MALLDEFHAFLDEEWPLWKQPKNNGSVKYHQLYRAFKAGYRLSEDGIAPKALGDMGKPISLLEPIVLGPRKFIPPQRPQAKKPHSPKRNERG